MTDVGLVTVMALALALAMAMALAMYISVRHTALVHENKRLLGDAIRIPTDHAASVCTIWL